MKKKDKLALRIQYFQTPLVRKLIKCLIALAHVPAQQAAEGLQVIFEKFPICFEKILILI